MSFAAWKKRSSLFSRRGWSAQITELCQAAYKAGERDGRKQVEEMNQQAVNEIIALHEDWIAKGRK